MSAAAVCKTTFAIGSDLNVRKTLDCGQCFRWNANENGVYVGVVSGKVLHIHQKNDKIMCDCDEKELDFWRNYFDMDEDYLSVNDKLTEPEYLRICSEYGAGIHILRQESWETLCSFIISQCNNIPRIKQIIEALCTSFGNILPGGYYSFPSPERLAVLSEMDLAPLRSGYRASYILGAARAVSEGILNFDELSADSSEEAFLKLKQLKGVGDKVANCFMLYGMHHMDRFPIDTWMKRALKNHFPRDFDPSILGPNSGLAQQYIFYYARNGERELSKTAECC